MTRADTRLHCAIAGAGPDLVLLHPAGLDHTFMDSLARRLSADHRVLSVDLRGHGRSPDAQPGTTLDDLADDVRELVSRHCPDGAAVLGISLGGMVAQALALAHPKSVSALMLCGCTGTFDDTLRPMLRERGLAAERDGMAAVVEATLDRWFTAAERHGTLASTTRERLLADRVENWSATWHAIAGHDALPRLGGVAVPTLVVAGELDQATPQAATQRLADAVPGARWACLQGAPHMMQLEAGDALSSLARDFLAQARGGKS
jgi:3-oxoadipate enol-lactonase